MKKLLVLIAAAAAALAALPAVATAQWSPPQELQNQDQNDVRNRGVATANDGTTTALLQQVDEDSSVQDEGDVFFPYLNRRGPGSAAWSGPKRPGGIPLINEGTDEIGDALLTGGSAGLFFPFSDGGTRQIFGGLWPAGAPDPAAVSKLVDGYDHTSALSAAGDGQGNHYVVYTASELQCVGGVEPIPPLNECPENATENKPNQSYLIVRIDAAGVATSWDTGIDGRVHPFLAVGPNGQVALTYLRHLPADPDANRPAQDRFYVARGAFGAGAMEQFELIKGPPDVPGDEAHGVEQGQHAAAVDDSGNIAIVYARRIDQVGNPTARVVWAHIWRKDRAEADGKVNISRNSASQNSATNPQIGVDQKGRFTAGWLLRTGGDTGAATQVQIAERFDELWHRAQDVSSSDVGLNAALPQFALAVDREGTATVLLSGTGVWAARRATQASAASQPVKISQADGVGQLRVSARPGGQADASWVEGEKVLASRFGGTQGGGGGGGGQPGGGGSTDKGKPTVKLDAPTLASEDGTSTSFDVSWTGTDAEGSALRFQLQSRERSSRAKRTRSRRKRAKRPRARKSLGKWKTVSRSRITGSSFRLRGSRGRTYEFRVRATDEAGNRSAWARARTVVPFDERSRGVSFGRGWSSVKHKGAYNGRFRVASRKGARMTFRFKGKSVYLVAPTGVTGGVASVFLNGRRVKKSVSFYSSKGKDRVMVFKSTRKGLRTQRLTVVVQRPKSRPSRRNKVAIDAIGVEDARY